MYEKILDLVPRAIFAAILGSIGAAGFIFCLGPAWSFNIQRLLRLQAMMLNYRSAVLLHRRVNKVPAAVTGLAFVQLATISVIACVACAVSPADVLHLTGSLLLGGFAIWAVLGAGRDANGLITTVKTSNMMRGCLMIEREVWHEQPSRLGLLADAVLSWLKGK